MLSCSRSLPLSFPRKRESFPIETLSFRTRSGIHTVPAPLQTGIVHLPCLRSVTFQYYLPNSTFFRVNTSKYPLFPEKACNLVLKTPSCDTIFDVFSGIGRVLAFAPRKNVEFGICTDTQRLCQRIPVCREAGTSGSKQK
jgi:hypothetical protein